MNHHETWRCNLQCKHMQTAKSSPNRNSKHHQPDPTSIGRTPFWASRQAQWPWQPHGIHNSCLQKLPISMGLGCWKKNWKNRNIARKYWKVLKLLKAVSENRETPNWLGFSSLSLKLPSRGHVIACLHSLSSWGFGDDLGWNAQHAQLVAQNDCCYRLGGLDSALPTAVQVGLSWPVPMCWTQLNHKVKKRRGVAWKSGKTRTHDQKVSAASPPEVICN